MNGSVPMVVNDGGADVAEVGLRMRGQTTGPGDVAVGVWVQRVLAFGENPAGAGVVPAKREVIGRDVAVLRGCGDAFLTRCQLVDELEGDVGFFGAEIDGAETGFNLAG